MPSAIGGVAQGAADVVASNIQAKANQAIAQQAEDAQKQLSLDAFNRQVNYANNQEQGARNAAVQTAQDFGNPYASARAFMSLPSTPATPASGQFGGGVYNGSGYASGLTGTAPPGSATNMNDPSRAASAAQDASRAAALALMGQGPPPRTGGAAMGGVGAPAGSVAVRPL